MRWGGLRAAQRGAARRSRWVVGGIATSDCFRQRQLGDRHSTRFAHRQRRARAAAAASANSKASQASTVHARYRAIAVVILLLQLACLCGASPAQAAMNCSAVATSASNPTTAVGVLVGPPIIPSCSTWSGAGALGLNFFGSINFNLTIPAP